MKDAYTLIEKKCLIKEGATVVVGVSGGPDSLALLHFLHHYKKKWRVNLVAAHLDHMFRGEQSKEEMDFVMNYCAANSITCVAKQVNVSKYAVEKNLSPQVAARECRYTFYKNVMDEHHATYLALGHHADDQIETILMRLVRGASGESLAGMKVSRPFHRGYLIRPFLKQTKDQIVTYCHEHGLLPRHDPSNEKTDYTRNRFRKFVLPFLKAENPLVHERFHYFSETFLEDESYLQVLTEQHMNTVIKRNEKSGMEIDIKSFLNLPLPLQRRGIKLILNYLYKYIPSSLSSIHIESLQTLLSQEHPSGELDFPNGLKVIKSYNICMFTFEHSQTESYQLELEIPSRLVLPNGFTITSSLLTDQPFDLKGNDVFLMRYEAINEPLIVRTREQGDKMKLKGMNGRKKVKDIFIDAKISLHSRHSWPIVEDGNGNILWIPGLKKSVFEDEWDQKGEFVLLQLRSLDLLGGAHS
ncbi:tRNA lysidine(34) synthetase TilS [Bacillus weihaiensis]|uniref:tRNA(Ile)-lysidine synthase n=1 Tax=Bacillus weihaiensis TaxID=1547283 RepID=A0A1L3MWJ0_9BACI|nr:tRNA lysidine(34) synthetase TilS [Bacillus weihaiensis]APH06709.1 tRNA lysidine(34) synthetase TilS [Bacillus weihaiensis]